MKTMVYTVAVTGAVLTAAVGLAGHAVAAPSGNASVDQTVEDLRSQGYSVQLNGTRNGPLTGCSINDVRGMSDGGAPGTVYVDLSCPEEYIDD
ncbi:MAG: hypothetical protein ABWY45_00675 [Mycobacterium sp.]